MNGFCYIGQSINIKNRWNLHKQQFRKQTHSSRYFQRAWNKYGEENFKFEVLFYCDRKYLIFFEQRAMDIFKPEYNGTLKANSCLGNKHSDETKRKISEAYHNLPQEVKERMKRAVSESNRIRPACSQETRDKISKANKGRIKSKEEIEKCSKSRLGQKRSPEARKRMSDARKAYFLMKKQEDNLETT